MVNGYIKPKAHKKAALIGAKVQIVESRDLLFELTKLPTLTLSKRFFHIFVHDRINSVADYRSSRVGVGCRMSDVVCRMSDVGCRMSYVVCRMSPLFFFFTMG